MTVSGVVSRVLEQQVLAEVRRQGTVVWLDKDAAYTGFVDRLIARPAAEGTVPVPVLAFRGSFLELLFALEPYGSGLDRQPLLIHLPGLNEETVRQTPLLELYELGVRYRKSLDTLIREAAAGRAAPGDVDDFLSTSQTLETADAWLASAPSQRGIGLALALQNAGPTLLAQAVANPKDNALSRFVASAAEADVLADYLHNLTGLDTAWTERFGGEAGQTPASEGPLPRLLTALVAWVLCVEYVHDLRRAPHSPELVRLAALSPPLVKASRDLVNAIRTDGAEVYARLADEVAGHIAEELSVLTPEDLGQIDTFREEEISILTGAVAALHQGRWAQAKAWYEARKGKMSFWLDRDQLRRRAWDLVAEAADFGAALDEHPQPFAGVQSLEQAVECYTARAYLVDRAHRGFEQRRLVLLEPRLPHYGALREVATRLREAHRAWANGMARAFAAVGKHHGFLPPPVLQQRALFDQVVYPLTLQGEKVALFTIDAFRYEMATELVDEITEAGAVVDLRARLAELPTITAVGMNVLAPVAEHGRLTVVGELQGFKAGEFTVRRPADRAKVMGTRSGGEPALLLTLSEVCGATTVWLTNKVKRSPLIIVHSKDIDDAGEANVGLPTFESTLRQIKAAWHHLQQAGVKSFVFTADHGFLLQDETTEIRPYGKKTDPQRRYVLDEYPREEPGMVAVALASLGYDGIGGYALFRDDTAVFATGNPGATFVHGGLSPQERVIPVLTVTRKRRELAEQAAYDVEAEPLPDVVGQHRLRLRVIFARDTTASLSFATVEKLDLALRAPARDTVRAVVKDMAGPGTLRGGRIQVPVGDVWTELFFSLEGPADERVRIEVYHPDNRATVRAATPEWWFDVSGTRLGVVSSAPAPRAAPTSATWADAIDDEAIRRVFRHLDEHGAVTETEVTAFLGSPRAFRRFSLDFESYLTLLPFRVRIETAESGKRYVRERD